MSLASNLARLLSEKTDSVVETEEVQDWLGDDDGEAGSDENYSKVDLIVRGYLGDMLYYEADKLQVLPWLLLAVLKGQRTVTIGNVWFQITKWNIKHAP